MNIFMLNKPRRGGRGRGEEGRGRSKKERKKKERKKSRRKKRRKGKKCEAGKSHFDPVPASVYDSRLSKTIVKKKKKMKLNEPESKK